MKKIKPSDLIKPEWGEHSEKCIKLLEELKSIVNELEKFNIKIDCSFSYLNDDPVNLKDFISESVNQ